MDVTLATKNGRTHCKQFNLRVYADILCDSADFVHHFLTWFKRITVKIVFYIN